MKCCFLFYVVLGVAACSGVRLRPYIPANVQEFGARVDAEPQVVWADTVCFACDGELSPQGALGGPSSSSSSSSSSSASCAGPAATAVTPRAEALQKARQAAPLSQTLGQKNNASKHEKTLASSDQVEAVT